MRRVLALLALLLPTLVAAQVYSFDDPAQEARFRSLGQELRCLVCQGQSIADSNAELAQDLKREVYRMIREGRSDQEIKDFMVARYGDYVLLTPPMKSSTYLLWFGPFVLLAIGLAALLVVIKRRPAKSGISAEERERARELLGRDVQEHD
jgi:Uncharacterized protein involved in biosynthesis of c-type cytochromes